jgi:nucleotide-binding universal stress UspA family protein
MISDSAEVAWNARVVILGRLWEEIVTSASREECDLIVMERPRQSFLASMFSERTLDRVSREAPCPVLCVDASNAGASAGGWLLPVLRNQFT